MADAYHGFEWKEVLFGIQPNWTIKPDLTAVAETARIALEQLNGSSPLDVKAELFGKGAYNRLYKITSSSLPDPVLLRVTIPVDPKLKTLSEVATIKMVKSLVPNVPIPEVMTWNATNQNALNFEWMMVELAPGKPLYQLWTDLHMQQKTKLVKDVAQFQVKLYQKKWHVIGNLGSNPRGSMRTIGRVVSSDFMLGASDNLIGFRGPFKSDYDWFHARITLILLHIGHKMIDEEDEEELDALDTYSDLGYRMLRLLPRICSPDQQTTTCLSHHDLEKRNMLVDKDGKLTAIVDWECMPVMPLWKACNFPLFLQGEPRLKEPNRAEFGSNEGVFIRSKKAVIDEDDVDYFQNWKPDYKGTNVMYWRQLEEYEKTVLREVFLKEVERLDPTWIENQKNNVLLRSYDVAIGDLQTGCNYRYADDWLDLVEEGEVVDYHAYKMKEHKKQFDVDMEDE